MGYTGDEVAGVVEVFGALTRTELREALAELSYRTSGDADEAGARAAVEDALASYHLVPVGEDPELLVAGPAAFPTLPARADDLPHLLEVPERSPDGDRVRRAAERRFRREAAAAVASGEESDLDRLLDASYDLESWGVGDLDDVRDRIDAHRESRIP